MQFPVQLVTLHRPQRCGYTHLCMLLGVTAPIQTTVQPLCRHILIQPQTA
jgi:hypothetical protein